eukprot:m.215353 g.215353  ORF g.215353 m.215353 type:complete len:118 (+) comp13800_c0_seq2:1827-2180(+)
MGRVVIDGEVPIKVRPATQRKKRGGDEEDGRSNKQKELFAEWQTEAFRAPLLVDGALPKNKHGTIEIFHPNMKPIGTTHLLIPGVGVCVCLCVFAYLRVFVSLRCCCCLFALLNVFV